jgi:hypothetical protein
MLVIHPYPFLNLDLSNKAKHFRNQVRSVSTVWVVYSQMAGMLY